MPYSAGNLLVNINGSAQNANRSIDSTIRHLNSLKTAIEQLTTVDTSASKKIVSFFSRIANGVKQIDTTGITNLGAALKSLSSVSRIIKLDKLDWNKITNGFNNLTTAITPFINKVQAAESSLNALYGILQKSSGKKIQNLLDPVDKKGKKSSADKLFNLAKITMFYRMARRVGAAVANIVQYGVDYTETLNLWSVAMRDNLSQADEFIRKMNRAYGISEKTLMNSQAIFKNMLGSLGQISGDTAYSLSETLVQMAADFASLYNVSFETALNKLQAMLAGQVRPIRSAGLDITETTLFQYYQAMGGQKTMRQLTRTEKNLLAIYAVFQQMGKAGALGDMQKTLNQFANQSRMISDNFKTMLTWAGVIGKAWIENTGVLIYVNALLITMGDILRAIAGSMHAIDSEDFLDSLFKPTEATNDEIDELQGKLLDFDKFRSLSGSEQSILGIDEKLLEAIKGYESIVDESRNKSRKIADDWLKAIGFTVDENGQLTITNEKLDNIKSTIKDIGVALGVIAGYFLVTNIVKLITHLFTLTNALNLVQFALIGGIVYAIVTAIKAFKEGDKVTGAIAITFGVVLVGALIAFKIAQHKALIATNGTTVGLLKQTLTAGKLKISFGSLTAAIGAFVASFALASVIIGQFDGKGKKIASVCFIVVGAIMAVVAAVVALNTAMSWGTMLPMLLAGVGAAIAGVVGLTSSLKNVAKYEVGASDIDGGSLFIAGEAGKTEAVFNGSNGKSNVANISQMQQAFYNALVQYGRENRDSGSPIVVQIDGNKVFEATRRTANKRGLDFKKV